MKQKDRILSYQEQIASLRNSNRALEKALAKEKEQHKEESAQKDAEIQALKNKVAHLEALANRDGTNTGTPTSRTPIGRKKVIPNLRRGSNKKKGDQPGHKKHVLESFNNSEVDEHILHELDTRSEICSLCGSSLIFTGSYVEKDEFDVTIKTANAAINMRFMYARAAVRRYACR